MARTITPLTDTKIKTAKAKEKDYKLFDGGGLFLLVTKRNSKLWRLKYNFDGKEKLISLGAYPSITLNQARTLREKHKSDIASGINPTEHKRQKKELIKQEEIKNLNTFQFLALQRLEQVEDEISESHYKRIYRGFKNDVFPFIGNKPIDDVLAEDIINILQVMMKRGVRNSAKQVYHAISKTFKWAVANAKAKRNPATDIDLSEIIGKSNEKHYPTITDDKGIKNLLISIQDYTGEYITKQALMMMAYTFVRTKNIRFALWSEINFETKLWTIPPKKMKTKDEFIVPLTDTVVKLLKDVQEYSNDSIYIFPSVKSKSTPMSDGALLGAIRRMGYSKDEFTPHGFRAMFSTIAHQNSGFKYEVIETQLAHSVGNSVSKAYNRAKYLNDRVKLMKWWSDYLDNLLQSSDKNE
jgi:integrase